VAWNKLHFFSRDATEIWRLEVTSYMKNTVQTLCSSAHEGNIVSAKLGYKCISNKNTWYNSLQENLWILLMCIFSFYLTFILLPFSFLKENSSVQADYCNQVVLVDVIISLTFSTYCKFIWCFILSWRNSFPILPGIKPSLTVNRSKWYFRIGRSCALEDRWFSFESQRIRGKFRIWGNGRPLSFGQSFFQL